MTFGDALIAVKNGKKVRRTGWEREGQFIVYQKGYPNGIPCNKNTAEAFGYQEGELFKCKPYLMIRLSDGSHEHWNPSQSDILEDDWEIIN